MGPTKDVTEKTGKEIAVSLGSEVLQVTPSLLRSFAGDLDGHAANLRTLATKANALPEDVTAKAKEFTANNQPAPIYGETVSALTDTTKAFNTKLSKWAEQLENDAAGLRWIADMNEFNEAEMAALISGAADGAEKMSGTGNGAAGSGGTNTGTPPAPSDPVPPSENRPGTGEGPN